MLISLNWISDFVDLSGVDTDKLLKQFSLSTAEVENDIFYKGRDISGIVVAEIKSVEEHPESKKLHLLKVDAGEAELVDVVCGAPNVKVGMKTAFAKLGAKIGDITIAPRSLAGYTSHGMCCSESELGISDDNSGIMCITEDVPCGTDLKEIYDIEDVIFEVDNKSLTNRPDLWGHYGIAREIATLLGRELKPLEVADVSKYNALPEIDLKIEDKLCHRYSCISFKNISRTVSPVNMRIRLFYCGMRAINYLADLTNYLMLETGQPMHAFDSRKIEKIRVKRFADSFGFATLDGNERKIDDQTLMICNGDTPVAIAGIMGGLDSEIVEDTTSLTLESATFDAASIRKSSSRLGLRTDASMRYEKSLDPELTVTAIARFIKLLSQYDAGVEVISRLTDEYAYKYDEIVLNFNKDYVNRYTGIEISNETIVNTLVALGFGVKNEGDEFSVKVPSWRGTKDVTLKADIIEEITRIYGYDNFDVNTTLAPLYPVRAFDQKSVEEQIKDILVKRYSLHELHSYIWAYAEEYKKLGIEIEENVKLLEATNPNIETIRRSIIPTQLCQLKINTSYAKEFGIFEIGRVVRGFKEDGLVNERKMLAVSLFSKESDVEKLYFDAVGMICTLADDIKHAKVTFESAEADHGYVHPKNYNSIICAGKEIGKIGIVHPTVAKKVDKKCSIVFFEIDTNLFAEIEATDIKYVETSKFPSIDVDLTFVVDKYKLIADAIAKVNSPLITKEKLVGTYTDEAGKSITIRLTFSDSERTLTKDEVMAIVDKIIAELSIVGVALKA